MLFNFRRRGWWAVIIGFAVLLMTTTVLARSDRYEQKPTVIYDHFIYLPLIMGRTIANYDWLQFNGDPQHSGNNTQETTLTASNVVSLTHLFQASLPAVADGAPVYLSAAPTINGTINLIFVTTKTGDVMALNARTGGQVWSRSHPAGTCKINQGPNPCYTTSSPVIDPNRLYVYSYGLDGKVHKHQVHDGTEIAIGGWPESATLKPEDEKGSSALSLAIAANGSSYLYVTSAGYPGDRGDYQGHVTAINLGDGTQHVFNTMCSDQPVHFLYTPSSPFCNGVQSAIWARAGVVYISATNKIYMATGNGTFNPSQHYWGDTVFSLNPDGTGLSGNPLKTYTPVNYQALQNSDTDIGSTNIAVLPTAITSTVQHLGLQGGKDSIVRLIDLDQMSSGSPGLIGGDVFSTTVPQGGEILTAPAVWINPSNHTTWVFVSTNSGLAAFQVTYSNGNAPRLTSKWHTFTGGTSPIIANNVLYYASSDNMQALDPITGKTLWKDNSFMGGVHWESPIIVNGVLYITDQNSHLNAYALP